MAEVVDVSASTVISRGMSSASFITNNADLSPVTTSPSALSHSSLALAVAEAVLATTAFNLVIIPPTVLNLVSSAAATATLRVITARTVISPRTGAGSSARTATTMATVRSVARSPLVMPMLTVVVTTVVLPAGTLATETPLLLLVAGVVTMLELVLRSLLETGPTA